jgi:HPt (histidine-containing phosphotransfer) domain-containing protein
MDAIETLRELGGEDDPGLLGELIAIFLEDAPGRLREIEQGFAAGDGARVESAAHALRSSSANLGALTLSHLATRIESLARSGALPQAGGLVAETTQLWPRVAGALRQLAD